MSFQAPMHILAAGEGPYPWQACLSGSPPRPSGGRPPQEWEQLHRPVESLWGRLLPSSVLTSAPPAVICFLLRVMSQYLMRSRAPSVWGLGVLFPVSEHPPPFGAGRYPRPGPSWAPAPALESTISPGSLVSLEWLRNLGVGPVSQHHEPCGSCPLCAALPPGCCPVPESRGRSASSAPTGGEVPGLASGLGR